MTDEPTTVPAKRAPQDTRTARDMLKAALKDAIVDPLSAYEPSYEYVGPARAILPRARYDTLLQGYENWRRLMGILEVTYAQVKPHLPPTFDHGMLMSLVAHPAQPFGPDEFVALVTVDHRARDLRAGERRHPASAPVVAAAPTLVVLPPVVEQGTIFEQQAANADQASAAAPVVDQALLEDEGARALLGDEFIFDE